MTLIELQQRLAEIQRQIQAIRRDARWKAHLTAPSTNQLAIPNASALDSALAELEAVTQRLSAEVALANFAESATRRARQLARSEPARRKPPTDAAA